MPHSNGYDELVPVQVPRRHLAAVYAFIARLEQEPGAMEPAPQPAGPAWSEALVARAYRESDSRMRRILEYLASRPEERIPTGDVVGHLGEEPLKLAGAMGAFGRRVANRYGLRDERGAAIFPFRHRWDPEVGSRVYVVPAWVATAIAGAAAESAR